MSLRIIYEFIGSLLSVFLPELNEEDIPIVLNITLEPLSLAQSNYHL